MITLVNNRFTRLSCFVMVCSLLAYSLFLPSCEEEERVPPEEIIWLTCLDTIKPANGDSLCTCTVSIPEEATDSVNRIILLTTTAGVFILNSNDSITIKPNNKGNYTFDVKVSTIPGTYFIRAFVNNAKEHNDEISIVLEPLRDADVVSLHCPDTLFSANGKDICACAIKAGDYVVKAGGEVKLKTRAGKFTNGLDSIIVKLTPSGTDSIRITVHETPGKFELKLLTKDNRYQDVQNLTLTKVNLSDVLKITSVTYTPPILANGEYSFIINYNFNRNNTARTILTASANNRATLIDTATDLRYDLLGNGGLRVRTTQQPGDIYVRIAVAGTGYFVDTNLVSVYANPDNVLKITSVTHAPPILANDDYSFIINYNFNRNNTARTTLTATTNARAAFIDTASDLRYDLLGNGAIRMKTTQQPGDIYIRIALPGTSYFADTTLSSTHAYPDKIINIYSPTVQIDSTDDTAQVSAQLHRFPGKVSTGTKVTFKATQIQAGQETPVGSLSNATAFSDTNQQVSTTFRPDIRVDFNNNQPIKIYAITPVNGGGSDTTFLLIGIN